MNKRELVKLLLVHQPNVVMDGPGDLFDYNLDQAKGRWRIKCEGDDCDFYVASHGTWEYSYRTVMEAHAEHLANVLVWETERFSGQDLK